MASTDCRLIHLLGSKIVNLSSQLVREQLQRDYFNRYIGIIENLSGVSGEVIFPLLDACHSQLSTANCNFMSCWMQCNQTKEDYVEALRDNFSDNKPYWWDHISDKDFGTVFDRTLESFEAQPDEGGITLGARFERAVLKTILDIMTERALHPNGHKAVVTDIRSGNEGSDAS